MHKLKLLFIFLIVFFSFSSHSQNNYEEFYANGNIKIKGQLKNNLQHGLWIEFDSLTKDTISFFNYKKGVKHGNFSTTYVGTNRKSKFITSKLDNYSNWNNETFTVKGRFKQGLLHGKYKEFYSSGQLYLYGRYKDNVKQGTFIEYHDNGNKSLIENYVNGKRHGNWKQFYNTGKLREERKYELNSLITSNITEWYDNGNKMNYSSYKHINNEKVPNGEFIQYYENGEVQTYSLYEDGKPNGKWKGFYNNGNIKFIIIYENFSYKSYTKFDKNGIEIKE